ncbi:RidA family protein [Bordetella hinzii]|uniref:Reactive intermediate/imine deaminase n=1 Tax=Bordetella hinzii OH87 BAL007II TaxID=1331262 RepID=A0ABR4R7I7_9BORD|nr:RidA family protein [Bordetella hinzii]KCB26368.1 reactive intermediate/imine deaminase [Bordetella hinzii OH87 BAL007II]KCB32537.1 reactive intermediate/imine deaminase [Bordetella hinzii CA90 BAL1384]KCB41060.1 reactive intermediate/imine deaminase [Bordetella hinzii 5132]QDJ40353.1 RidA family protein [Bordetella hinzii]QDJ44864.1 RidA family protein [Bordetella hinzii]
MAGEPQDTGRRPAALATPAGHYSHFKTGGGLVFISGQLPITPEGKQLADAPFEQQARQALANVDAALASAGCDIDRLLHVRVYLDDIENWPAFDRVYAEWLGPARPARAVVPTRTLHYGFKVEVEAIAADRAGGAG